MAAFEYANASSGSEHKQPLSFSASCCFHIHILQSKMQKCCPTRKTFWFGFIIPNVQVFLFPVSKLHNKDRRVICTYEPVNYNFKCLHCDISPLSYLPAENTAGKGGCENKQNWVNKRNKSRSKRVKLLLLSQLQQ